VLQKHSSVQLVGTIDPSAEARQWSIENLGVRHFSDLEGAFKEVDTDAVLVTTPPRLHVPVLMNALEHRKHVLVEKPLAVSPGEIGELLAAVSKSEAKVMVAQGYRFMDSAVLWKKFRSKNPCWIGECPYWTTLWTRYCTGRSLNRVYGTMSACFPRFLDA
jgi:predicted dehydrogenase